MNNAPVGRPAAAPRVLLWMPAGRRVLGGHVVQLEKTATALSELGVDVRTDFSAAPDPTELDLVHGFGLEAQHIRYWHRRGIPVVLSTVYWARSYRLGDVGRPSVRALAGRAFRAGRFGHAALSGRAALIESCMEFSEHEMRSLVNFEAADLLLPNAEGEGESLRRDYGVSTPIRAVPNGVDPRRFSPPDATFESRSFVLYVGRIEPHKNQLGLIRALQGSDLPLTIAGSEHPDHPHYVRECHRAGADWVRFVSEVPHDSELLSDLYRGARVHVVPSWFETTGLVSLEAALSGCSVVSTSRGYAREYLEELAWYCDPADDASVLTAVRRAWGTPPDPALRQRVLDRYTWRHVAEATVAAYGTLPPRVPPAG